MSKQIQAGPVSLEVAVSGGIVSLNASLSQSLGGGQVAGILSGTASLGVQLGAQQAADLALAVLEARFPTLAVEIEVVKKALDSELASVSV
jgi:hypothetical protein